MKKMKLLSLILLFSFSTFLMANDNDPKDFEKAKIELKEEIEKLLKGPDLRSNDIKDCKVNVHFVINSQREIRVIDIYTTNDYLKTFIEDRLDNKKVKTKDVRIRKTYLIPVQFELS